MAHPKIEVGLYLPAQPPLGSVHQFVWAARLLRLDSVIVWDHVQDFFPTALWDKDFTWMAAQNPTQHAFYDYQVLLGHLAARAGRLRLGVGVTEPIRRHPVLIAQAMMTLAHLTKRPPILGIGAGERENTEPYGLNLSYQVSKVEEALQIIRLCFSSQGPFDFSGKHFRLNGAVMDLQPPPGRTPEIWVAAHGPRMLQLTGMYGDGWYPAGYLSPEEYGAKLQEIRTAAERVGRDPDAITPALYVNLVVAPTEAEARAMLGTPFVRFLSLLASADFWRQFGAVHPFGDQWRGYVDIIPEHYDRRTLDEAMAAVPAEVTEAAVIWGTPEQVIARFRAYGEVGMRYVVPAPASAAVSQQAALHTLRSLFTIRRALQRGA